MQISRGSRTQARASFPAMTDAALIPLLARIADSLERLAPPPARDDDVHDFEAYVWQTDPPRLQGVPSVSRVPLDLLQGIDLVRDLLVENTRRFAAGLPANNALLWGARGMGKSSLVKAAHAAVAATQDGALALVEIAREDLATLPDLLRRLRGIERRFILFCDDLSFDGQDAGYKSLKAVLDGGIEGRPPNVVFYATSNRRHLLSRDMIENERSTAIHPGEAVEEKVSLSDRFGLWLGFHGCDQDRFFAMIEAYAAHFALDISTDALRAAAIEWSVTRGSRSGRVAWQFIQDLAGRLGQKLGN